MFELFVAFRSPCVTKVRSLFIYGVFERHLFRTRHCQMFSATQSNACQASTIEPCGFKGNLKKIPGIFKSSDYFYRRAEPHLSRGLLSPEVVIWTLFWSDQPLPDNSRVGPVHHQSCLLLPLALVSSSHSLKPREQAQRSWDLLCIPWGLKCSDQGKGRLLQDSVVNAWDKQ